MKKLHLHTKKSVLCVLIASKKTNSTNMFKYINTLNYISTLAVLLAAQTAIAQGVTIPVKNGSFEDFPQPAHCPLGWHDCGAMGETPPDVFPHPAFQVTAAAHTGKTYLGLVVRDNETNEGVSQKLSSPLEKGHCYNTSIWAMRSNKYVSVSKTSGNLENFNKAVKIIIWGGNSDCDKRENLFETGAIETTSWEQVNIKLKPKNTYAYIFIEAYYVRTMVPYNGNVLLDNFASIVEDISCGKTPPPDTPKIPATIAQNTPRSGPRKSRPTASNPAPPTPRDTPPTPRETPRAEAETRLRTAPSIDRLDPAKVVVNQRFNMNSVLFDIDSYVIKESSYEQLDKLAVFLKGNAKIVVEIGGHTNGNADPAFAIELSTNRAKAVADYLRDKGVENSQLQTHGYGRTYPVATNETEEGKRLNQRVEVKILKK